MADRGNLIFGRPRSEIESAIIKLSCDIKKELKKSEMLVQVKIKEACVAVVDKLEEKHRYDTWAGSEGLPPDEALAQLEMLDKEIYADFQKWVIAVEKAVVDWATRVEVTMKERDKEKEKDEEKMKLIWTAVGIVGSDKFKMEGKATDGGYDDDLSWSDMAIALIVLLGIFGGIALVRKVLYLLGFLRWE